ncbi:MAG: potassium transporter TrkG [Burkholderiales bacterium]
MANEGLEALAYAVRPAVVARYVGELLLVFAVLAIPPALVGFWYSKYGMAWHYLVAALALAASGWLLTGHPAPARIQANEALVVTAAAYLLASCAMAYHLAAAGLGWGDALFESVSGITTTGLSVITDVDSMPRTMIFVRSWLQWCGGLGIVVFSIALLMGNDVTVRRLIDPAPAGEDLATTTRTFARRVAVTYAALTFLAVAALAALGLPKASRVVCVYRKEEFILADGHTRLHEGDEVIVIAHGDAVSDLEDRWGRGNRAHAPAGGKSSGARQPG